MKRAVLLSMAVVCAAVFLFLASGNVMAQIKSGAVPDMPDNPWAEQAIAAETMISEAQQTIDRCNQQIAAAERMKRRAQEGRAKAEIAGGTRNAAPGAGGASDQPNYPWLSMEQAADQMIADARRTIERCELQIKYGQKMKQNAVMEMGRWGR